MNRTHAILFATVVVACGTDKGGQELGPLLFDAPTGWHRTDVHERGVATAIFAPNGENTRKETVTVIRTEVSPAVAASGPALARLLVSAQGALADVHVSPVTSISTKLGLAGVLVDVDYVPPGFTRRYHRVHAVFSDGSALVHVMYTAGEPDADLTAFYRVVRSLHEES